MAIVIDELRTYRNRGRMSGRWCHMLSDTNDRQELEAFARRLGLKPSWLDWHGMVPHYDLRPSKRALAVELGAQEISWREMGRLSMRLLREAKAQAEANAPATLFPTAMPAND